MSNKYNTENLKNIYSYNNDLARAIDEADWLGEYDKVQHLVDEQKHIQELIDNGELYYPMF